MLPVRRLWSGAIECADLTAGDAIEQLLAPGDHPVDFLGREPELHAVGKCALAFVGINVCRRWHRVQETVRTDAELGDDAESLEVRGRHPTYLVDHLFR